MLGHLYSNLDEFFLHRGWHISQSKNVVDKPNEQHYIHSNYPHDEFRIEIEIEKKNIINVVVPLPKSVFLFKKTFISYSSNANDDEQIKDENLYNSVYDYIVSHMNNYEEKMN